MRVETKMTGPALIPAPEPQRSEEGIIPWDQTAYYFYGQGTARDTGVGPMHTGIGLWLSRWHQWRDGFEQSIGHKVRRYWNIYRAFDDGPLPGPNQDWRDRTVIPEAYKIIETRIPKLILSQFGNRNWFATRTREEADEEYEETVRILIEQAFDEVGARDHHDGGAMKRIIDGMRYCQIMGHVFWKVWWRKEMRPFKHKVPTVYGPDGKPQAWEDVDLEELIYDNIDFTWVPLDSIAIDLSNTKKWVIERVQTSLDYLLNENREYRRVHGKDLYKGLDRIHRTGLPPSTKDSFEEPRDTERWPLGEEYLFGDPGETTVELWLCWDNQRRTLTKIANRTILLDHGMAPTPDGLDPYISHPAVPIPGRVYGESILHYVGPLVGMQTRLARARMDEVLLNIWQQYVYRQGTVRNNKMLFRPGGAIPIEDANPERPISDHFAILPRRPLFTEAWTEEGHRQQQAESTAGADAISQGVEATQKSRDVAATEIQQRMMGVNARFNMESLYLEATFKRPLLQRIFDLLRQNLTEEKTVRVLGAERQVSLQDLDRPVDIVVGGGMKEASKAEEAQEVDELVKLSQTPVFQMWLKPRELLLEWFETRGRRDAQDLVRTEQEVQSEQQKQLAQAAAAAQQQAGAQPQPGGGGGQGQLPPGGNAKGPPTRGSSAGQTPERGTAGPRGEGPDAPPSSSKRMETSI